VPSVERAPLAAKEDCEPAREIHWVGDRGHPNVTKVAGAISRRNVQAPTERDGEVGKVAAYPNAFPIRFHCRPRIAGLLIVELQMP
jgi:hypothetical protein